MMQYEQKKSKGKESLTDSEDEVTKTQRSVSSNILSLFPPYKEPQMKKKCITGIICVYK